MKNPNEDILGLLYQRAVALNQVAREGQRAFLRSGHRPAGDGPVAIAIGERMRSSLISGVTTECGHPSEPAAWLPSAPQLLRCHACYADAWPEARGVCAGCSRSITTGGAFVGLIEAQVRLDAVVVGPWLVIYVLCAACQREDHGGDDVQNIDSRLD